MLYPIAAPGLAGAFASLAAGIATHGFIVSSVESKRARERIEHADQVLAPYRSVLDGFTTERLYAALKASHPDWSQCGEPAEPGTWQVEFASVFVLTQDETTVISQVAFNARPPVMPAKRRPRETAVQIVSSTLEASEFRELWIDQDGAVLIEKGAALVADAVEIALHWEAHEVSSEEAPFATYRFELGKNEHMERAQRVGGSCHRAILRTLRGQYLSVPITASEGEPACANDSPRLPPGSPHTSIRAGSSTPQAFNSSRRGNLRIAGNER